MDTNHISLPNGEKLGYTHVSGNGPGIIFLPGFQSDMSGIKSQALKSFCIEKNLEFTAIDYQAHGISSGKIENCTIGLWKEDVLHILDNICQNKQIIVGSSMGGWLAFLSAISRPNKICGLVGIAAAVDFTNDGWTKLSPEVKEKAKEKGVFKIEKPNNKFITITYKMIEESFNHLLLDKNTELNIPIHLLHGTKDEDVAWQHSQKILETIKSPSMKMTIVKDGDHRLSTPSDIDVLIMAVENLLKEQNASS